MRFAIRFHIVALLGLLSLFLSGCEEKAAPAAKPATKVRLAIDSDPQVEQGGYFSAQMSGYYAEAHLDVEIVPNATQEAVAHSVATGAAEFGTMGADSTLIAHEQGLPLIAIATSLQYDPQALMVYADSPVKTFADLSGHAVSMEPGVPWFPYLVLKYHLENVRVLPPAHTLNTFAHDSSFIQQAPVTSGPFLARGVAVKARMLPIRDSGYENYRVLVTNRDFAAKNPEVVSGFVAASLRGWSDYLDDGTTADSQIQRLNSAMDEHLMFFSWQALKDGNYIDGITYKGDAIGQMTPQRWQNLYNILKQVGALKTDFDPKDVYTTRFIPKPDPSLAMPGRRSE